jgi:hypothetical protein
MTNMTLGFTISRTLLGLGTLDLNDHTNFYIAPGTWGSAVSWDRTQVGSKFVDGKVTTHRVMEMVQEPLAVEIRGSTNAAMWVNIRALTVAMKQDTFQITTNWNGDTSVWNCEASDLQGLVFTGPRIIAKQMQATYQVLRQPVPVSGGY